MLWWVVGIVAAWLVLGALAAVWIGLSIRNADIEESAAELRRRGMHETQSVDGLE